MPRIVVECSVRSEARGERFGLLHACRFASKRQNVPVAVPPGPISIDADAQRFQQVFSNLLTNAAKFTPQRGRIDVVIELDTNHVAVRVRDTGRGISPEMLSRVFDLFTQGPPDERGPGIGLAMARGLVERHGGAIHAHSGGPGQGSEFIVTLPLVTHTSSA